MRIVNSRLVAAVAIFVLGSPWQVASADQQMILVERHLAALGYATGPVDGVETMETVIAISKFQAENQLPVTGEVTPQLVGILQARVEGKVGAAPAVAHVPPAVLPAKRPQDPVAAQAAQQACLQRKIAEAQEAQKKKRGLGRLMSAVTRTVARHGSPEIAGTVNDIHAANATAEDLAAAARDLGLTEDEVAACSNPE